LLSSTIPFFNDHRFTSGLGIGILMGLVLGSIGTVLFQRYKNWKFKSHP